MDTRLYANTDGTISEEKDMGEVRMPDGRTAALTLETVHGSRQQIAQALRSMGREDVAKQYGIEK
ncbi:hypothetical protein [Bifidobacterium scaligerum]|uniref:Uncharacterized protein n=1 Tax=Bifidobacterium scaligerum TaxID=2052656 RepID=A0A2M9HQD4_9BIFI|nr:hypothetical protein [Bifidobacterium scaligerum]PJM79019.1 hypothetical protein CUU80_06685 [Bifidobacterium scaligerum]